MGFVYLHEKNIAYTYVSVHLSDKHATAERVLVGIGRVRGLDWSVITWKACWVVLVSNLDLWNEIRKTAGALDDSATRQTMSDRWLGNYM